MRFLKSFGNNVHNNILIESENLIALDDLLDTYRGKIDIITIDPPYNTELGHIGYNDSYFSEGWGNFIKSRLIRAKDLMSEKGVMFINIDENELVELLLICYDIFGFDNVKIMIWPKIDIDFDQNRVEKPIHNIKSAHEYIVLCYMDEKNTKFGNMDNGNPAESIIKGLGTTSSAKDEIAFLFGSRDIFSTPKPMKLIKELIRISSKKNSIIMDFFAGSGTAGHAVMDLNNEDGGNRRFILVTNDENDICNKVTIPRLKKSIEIFGYNDGFGYYCE
jgi:adenine specific DNA methylase Mod